MIIRLFIIFFSLLAPARSAIAQTPDSLRLQPGDQIRLPVTLGGDDVWVRGSILEVWPHGFAYAPDGQPERRVEREFLTLETIDVGYRDSGESARGAAVLGGFVGASLGILAGALLASRVSLDTGTSMALGGAAGGMLGGLTGAITGAHLSPLRWHRYVFQGRRAAIDPWGIVTVVLTE